MKLVQITAETAYLGVAGAAFVLPGVPRLFWSVLLPLILLATVALRFHGWARVSPLAALAAAPRLRAGRPRRAPRWMRATPATPRPPAKTTLPVLTAPATKGSS